MLVGLDIGSMHVCAVAAELGGDGQLRIQHISEHPSEGVRSGSVINIETTMKIVQKTLEDIELETGREVTEITTGIGGSHIEGIMSEGVVGISRKDNEIQHSDVLRSLDVARSVDLPLDREVLHTLVQDFSVDGRRGVRDPIDMIGHRLETKVLMVTGDVTVSQNLKKCISRAGYMNQKLVLQQLADSEAVLTQEERDIGTLLINYGGGMCNMIAFRGGSPIYIGGVSLGGNEITSDLVYILNKPHELVEKIKIEYGCCYEDLTQDDDLVTIPPVGGWPSVRMPRRELCKIIEPRAAETLTIIKTMLQRRRVIDHVSGGVVFTGGSALMPGLSELAGEIFNAPVRIGMPRWIDGLDDRYISPQYATALGLVLHTAKRRQEHDEPVQQGRQNPKGGVLKRMKDFFEVLF